MSKTIDQLSEEIMQHISDANIVIVATISDAGEFAMELLSWVWPMDNKTVRLVISPNFPGGINLAVNGKAVLQILGDKLTYEIRGTARLVKENCESVKFPETMYDFIVEGVRENMFPASHLVGSIPYARDEGTEELHADLDKVMYAEIKSTPLGETA